MKSRRLWLVLAVLLFAAITTVSSALPSTVAYIVNQANTMRNTFRVEYLPPEDISVPVHVRKTVCTLGNEELSPAGFSFRLLNLNTGEVTAMTTFTDGWATVILPFTAEDVGKTFRYTLYEVAGDRRYMTYDDTIYSIAITIGMDEQHELIATATVNDEPVRDVIADFVNFYNPIDVPATGDTHQPLMWLTLLLVSTVGLALLAKKNALHRRA